MEQATSKDGTTIRFGRSGTGPPLLLVHGTTADYRRWGAISPHFAQEYTVYAIDRRGRGVSGDAPGYDFMREAEDVAAVVEAIGCPVSVLGHSFGAMCSLEAALLTDRIRKLILYEPPIPTGLPLYPAGVPDRIQARVNSGEWEAAVEVFFREIVGLPEQQLNALQRLPQWKYRVQLAPTIARELLFDRTYNFDGKRFAGVRVPTLLLLGGDSPPLFRRGTEMVHSALQNSKIVILPGQQHVAMDTSPELFVSEVLRFLQE